MGRYYYPDAHDALTAKKQFLREHHYYAKHCFQNTWGTGYVIFDTKEEVNQFLKAVASQGVTTVFPTTFPSVNDIGVKGILEADGEGASVGGIHFEGPFLHRVGEKGVPVPKIDIDLDIVSKIIDACEGKLKVMGHAPELANSTEMIHLLLENNDKRDYQINYGLNYFPKKKYIMKIKIIRK